MAVGRAEQQVGAFKGPVVVLADMDKAEMDAALAKGLQGCKMEVQTSCLTHSLVYSLAGLLNDSLTCSLAHSRSINRSLTYSLTHPRGFLQSAEMRQLAIKDDVQVHRQSQYVQFTHVEIQFQHPPIHTIHTVLYLYSQCVQNGCDIAEQQEVQLA